MPREPQGVRFGSMFPADDDRPPGAPMIDRAQPGRVMCNQLRVEKRLGHSRDTLRIAVWGVPRPNRADLGHTHRDDCVCSAHSAPARLKSSEAQLINLAEGDRFRPTLPDRSIQLAPAEGGGRHLHAGWTCAECRRLGARLSVGKTWLFQTLNSTTMREWLSRLSAGAWFGWSRGGHRTSGSKRPTVGQTGAEQTLHTDRPLSNPSCGWESRKKSMKRTVGPFAAQEGFWPKPCQ